MEKRYQVFVSSTFEDLIEERQEVMQALLELDCIPAGMELFPAANDDQWTLIKRVIDDCDYYIVISGGRYGSIGPDGKSYTQLEYEYALQKEKPIIAFIHKNPEDLPAKKIDKDKESLTKLQEFKNIIKNKMVKYWNSPTELGSVVSRSIIKLIKSNPAIGWVKADLLPDQDVTQEILDQRKLIDELNGEINFLKESESDEIRQLSQGEDLVELNFSFDAYDKNDNFKFRPTVIYKHSFEITWNDIFSNISPLLINEASERTLIEALNALITNLNYEYLSKSDDLKKYTISGFKINSGSFNMIKVQLMALNLIKKSTKSKSVKDRATYWTITENGEKVMVQLRAIKKPEFLDEKVSPKPSEKKIEEDNEEKNQNDK